MKAESDTEWMETIPILDQFAQVADPTCYVTVPDDWRIGVSDVVNSSRAIEDGRYKAVNLAGAGTICAVHNALGGALRLFTFGGDGARLLVSPRQDQVATEAMTRVAAWARRDLSLELRVGMTGVGEARRAGLLTRVAFWQPSPNARYAMFTGGGLAWAEGQLKSGAIRLDPAEGGQEPDLSGLSCQWGAVDSRLGSIVSLIVHPGAHATQRDFARVAGEVIALLEESASLNPLPDTGPDVRWPSTSMALQSRIARGGKRLATRRSFTFATSVLAWLVFKLGIRIGRFQPDRYRREVAQNTDFRKFDDGILMTIDCAAETQQRLDALLARAHTDGIVQYGMHAQSQALITCVVPTPLTPDHLHFIDGADGGYTSAARKLWQGQKGPRVSL